MKIRKPKTVLKYRLEYWEGRKYVRTFGSRDQANRFVSGLARPVNVTITPFLDEKR